jgi:uncharacterized membrane protein YqaE (UPF0057 family)
MRSLLLYLLALIIPPVAVFICGTVNQVILNVILWLCGCIPGVFHAFVVVLRYNNKNANRLPRSE